MKTKLFYAVAAMFIISGAKSATAAVFATRDAYIGGGSNHASYVSLRFDLNGLGIIDIAIHSQLLGGAHASVSLDGANNGTATIYSSSLLFTKFGNHQIGSVDTSFGTINYDFRNVIADLSFRETVSAGAFTIDADTPGELSLNEGSIRFWGDLVFFDPFDDTIDLTTDPIVFSFSDLGDRSLTGTADNSLGGVDTNDPGDEITISFANGLETSYTIDDSPLPVNVTLYGHGLSIGAIIICPEPTSGLFLAGLATGIVPAVRRHRASSAGRTASS